MTSATARPLQCCAVFVLGLISGPVVLLQFESEDKLNKALGVGDSGHTATQLWADSLAVAAKQPHQVPSNEKHEPLPQVQHVSLDALSEERLQALPTEAPDTTVRRDVAEKPIPDQDTVAGREGDDRAAEERPSSDGQGEPELEQTGGAADYERTGSLPENSEQKAEHAGGGDSEPVGAEEAGIPAARRSILEKVEKVYRSTVKQYRNIPNYCLQDIKNMYPEWSSAFEAKALERAIDKKILFTLTDKQYVDVLPCWRWAVETATGQANTLIVPTDKETLAACKKHKLPCVMADLELVPRIKVWGMIGFLKFYAMTLLAGLGITSIMSEMDVQIYKNPWPYHEEPDKDQYRLGWCNRLARDPAKNPPSSEADIQVSAHEAHSRVNIGYIYTRATEQTQLHMAAVLGYFIGKCPDKVLGWDHKLGTFVDDGLPDQNIYDAFLRNYDHRYPKYSDVPWKTLPKVKWKLLDYNVFGTVWGKSDHNMELVTNHFSGHGGKVSCWQSGVCKLYNQAKSKALKQFKCMMAVQRKCRFPMCNEPGLQQERCESPKCLPPCVPREENAPVSLQGAVDEHCLPVPMKCTGERLR
eukprot:TRINITY_DN102081_c0_g1_i1.p1 TRINITY_DN102081_c0_g1~~TRINITY_DN102081_c0_g1_i1.p1  ORF type:complete len:593 (-),score=110.39 TRINITY_DN102081_c0_g1_i1:615-2369(-)